MLRKLSYKLVAKKQGHITYSQSGEDRIINFIFESLGITHPTYIDIGAHDPFYINNTVIFYDRGSCGINIEPNSTLFAKFQKHRPRDINLNICIGLEEGTIDYYMMDVPTLNTVSREEALRLEAETNRKIVEVRQLPVRTLGSVLKQFHRNKFPDFLSLDVEGLDEAILSNIDFAHTAPKVICVETLEYVEQGIPKKNNTINQLLAQHDYSVYADTFINTIFVHNSIHKRQSA